jgi:hypothetical protein
MSILRSAPMGRKVAAALGLACAALLFGGVSSASAVFTQCPPIGADTGCGSLITVNPDGTGTVTDDATQPPYENVEDTLIGLQNNSSGTVNSLDLSSPVGPPDEVFNFDGDGICSIVISPQPAGCPFGPTEYEGPGTSFTNIASDFKSGTVVFTPAVGPGGSAYWSLENVINAANLNLGTIQVQGLSCGSIDVSAVGYRPKKSLNPTVPGVRAYIKVSKPSTVNVDASLSFSGAAAAKSVKLGSFTLQDSGSKKLRIPLPASLRHVLSIGDRVSLNLAIKSTPLDAPGCKGAATKSVSLKTRVVHILKREHN